MTSKTDIIEYLEHFKFMYESFLEKYKTNIESTFPNCIIDFDDWHVNHNGTGFANIWVQPTQKVIHQVKFRCPIKEVEIETLLIIIKTKLTDVKPKCKIVSFEMAGHYNPNEWSGRNSLDLQPSGKIITTGYNRVIIEQDPIFSRYHLMYVEQNFNEFFNRTMNYHLRV